MIGVNLTSQWVVYIQEIAWFAVLGGVIEYCFVVSVRVHVRVVFEACLGGSRVHEACKNTQPVVFFFSLCGVVGHLQFETERGQHFGKHSSWRLQLLGRTL